MQSTRRRSTPAMSNQCVPERLVGLRGTRNSDGLELTWALRRGANPPNRGRAETVGQARAREMQVAGFAAGRDGAKARICVRRPVTTAAASRRVRAITVDHQWFRDGPLPTRRWARRAPIRVVWRWSTPPHAAAACCRRRGDREDAYRAESRPMFDPSPSSLTKPSRW